MYEPSWTVSVVGATPSKETHVPMIHALENRWRSRGLLWLSLALASGACAAKPPVERKVEPSVPVAPPATKPDEPAPPSPAFTLSFEPEDSTVAAELEPVLRSGAREVERWFARPFREPFEVLLLPDRAAFTASPR